MSAPARLSFRDRSGGPKKIAFLATEDWFFQSHFLPFAREARSIGLDPILIARVRDGRAAIEREGCRVIALEAERSSLNPGRIFGNLAALRKVLRAEKPDIVHCISLRLAVLGGVAARSAGVKNIVLAPVGLGQLWISNSLGERIVRSAVRPLIGRVLRRTGTTYLFENESDPLEFGLKPDDPDVTVIGGAGVDPEKFYPFPEPPEPPVRIAIVARMVGAKGIVESLAAVKRAREFGASVELSLFGSIDTSNRSALTPEALNDLCRVSGATWHGHCADVAGVWRDHHIAMLLSEREGLPRSLIEAAACGRPAIATDVTGCNTVVRHEIEGLLVARGDVEQTSQAILRLVNDAKLRLSLGASAAQRFRTFFTEATVRETLRNVYLRYVDP